MAGFEYKIIHRTRSMDAPELETLLNEYSADNYRLKAFDKEVGFYVLERGISGRPKKDT